ncbi:MAG: flagellar protein FliS [Lachnospiraceae bacterium]|nr:flagellar protein FliS [Lachnospiraceae bacterium]
MKDELKQDYMLRISNANATALVVILYDMFDSYCDDAMEADPESEDFRLAIRHARGCLSELIESLNMEQEIARYTCQLYRFVERRLIMADIRRNQADIPRCIDMMKRLRNAYAEATKDDRSEALMRNTDVVYAGMTYGRSTVNTESAAVASNRGFLA